MKQKKKKRKRKIFLPLFLIFFIIIGFYSHQSYETAMHEQLPDSLIEFEQKYPEATDFVENYHKYKNKSFDLDVSHEVRKDNIPLFIQWDKRWGYKTYGSNFLGVNGCGPTSLSMVICGLTGKATWNAAVHTAPICSSRNPRRMFSAAAVPTQPAGCPPLTACGPKNTPVTLTPKIRKALTAVPPAPAAPHAPLIRNN